MRKIISFIITSAVAALCVVGHAQDRAFDAGEELSYTASYDAKLLSTDVADIVFRTTNESYKGTSCHLVEARATTRPFFSFFFKMDDTYRTWMTRSELRPLYSDMELREGSYRFKANVAFDWNKLKAHSTGHNLKRSPYSKHMALRAQSYDPIAMFFNLRNRDIGAEATGFSETVDVLLTDTIVSIRYRYVGREIIETPALGKVRCLKIQCELATIDGESFPEGSAFFMWLSDDKNRIPIYLETPIRVGRVIAVLNSFKNLANPFTAQIKDEVVAAK